MKKTYEPARLTVTVVTGPDIVCASDPWLSEPDEWGDLSI